MRSLAFLALLAVVATTPTLAATPRFVGTFQDWNVYAVDDANGRLCYAASEPKKEEGNYSRRGAAAVIVAKLPGDAPNEQVSVQPGYSFKANTTAQVSIDDRSFSLFTKGEHGWANSAKEDDTMIVAMKRGNTLKVRGTSTRDTWSLDTYSLTGFTAAYNSMINACK